MLRILTWHHTNFFAQQITEIEDVVSPVPAHFYSLSRATYYPLLLSILLLPPTEVQIFYCIHCFQMPAIFLFF
jgi:hypothetical protein